MLSTMQVVQLSAEKAFIRDGCEACEEARAGAYYRL